MTSKLLCSQAMLADNIFFPAHKHCRIIGEEKIAVFSGTVGLVVVMPDGNGNDLRWLNNIPNKNYQNIVLRVSVCHATIVKSLHI